MEQHTNALGRIETIRGIRREVARLERVVADGTTELQQLREREVDLDAEIARMALADPAGIVEARRQRDEVRQQVEATRDAMMHQAEELLRLGEAETDAALLELKRIEYVVVAELQATIAADDRERGYQLARTVASIRSGISSATGRLVTNANPTALVPPEWRAPMGSIPRGVEDPGLTALVQLACKDDAAERRARERRSGARPAA